MTEYSCTVFVAREDKDRIIDIFNAICKNPPSGYTYSQLMDKAIIVFEHLESKLNVQNVSS